MWGWVWIAWPLASTSLAPLDNDGLTRTYVGVIVIWPAFYIMAGRWEPHVTYKQ